MNPRLRSFHLFWRGMMARWFGLVFGFDVSMCIIENPQYIVGVALNLLLCWFMIKPHLSDDDYLAREKQ